MTVLSQHARTHHRNPQHTRTLQFMFRIRSLVTPTSYSPQSADYLCLSSCVPATARDLLTSRHFSLHRTLLVIIIVPEVVVQWWASFPFGSTRFAIFAWNPALEAGVYDSSVPPARIRVKLMGLPCNRPWGS
jgi:hypothetical protein